MLGSGAQTDDIETAIDTVGSAYGIDTIQRSVTFSGIAISHDPPGSGPPTTLLYTVPERVSDFARLAATSSVVRGIKAGDYDVAQAEAALDELDRQPPPYGRAVSFVAPGISAAGSTVVFGGAPLDAAVTLAVALLIQPSLSALERSTLPPFFRTVFGVAASTLLVAVLVGLGLPIVGGLVLTGSLLRFMPGWALVSGFSDLIDQSIISGSARLAEALLLGAGVAAGTGLALVVAGSFDVELSLVKTGPEDWGTTVAGLGALLAVGGYAIRIGDPRGAVVSASVLGAIAWLALIGMRDAGVDAAVATLISALTIGIVSRAIGIRAQGAGRTMGRPGRAATATWPPDRRGPTRAQRRRPHRRLGGRGGNGLPHRRGRREWRHRRDDDPPYADPGHTRHRYRDDGARGERGRARRPLRPRARWLRVPLTRSRRRLTPASDGVWPQGGGGVTLARRHPWRTAARNDRARRRSGPGRSARRRH